MNNRRSQKRLALTLIGVSLLLIGVLVIAGIRISVDGESYSYKTLNQASGSQTQLMAQPGSILDANGTYLAVSKVVYRVILDPKVMAETEKTFKGSMDKTIEMLHEILDLDPAELKEAYLSDPKSPYLRFKDVIITEHQKKTFDDAAKEYEDARKTYNEKVSKAKRNTALVVGVWFEKEYRREYPQKSVLSKVVGYTTEDAQEGIIGLENYYDPVLRGANGVSYSYIDSDGNAVNQVKEPENGGNLITSLDANVARLMQDGIREFQEETGGHRINVLAMDPNTGEIIAMASDTDFDLNVVMEVNNKHDSSDLSDLTPFFTEEELQHPEETFLLQEAFKGREDVLESMSYSAKLQALRQQVQMNFAVSATYEPGSTSKGLTLAACIEENVIAKNQIFTCDKEIPVADHIIHCHQENPCGDLIPIEAFGRSCNVCFVEYGLALGAERLAKYQELFNLGQKTGIDLPGEANTSFLIYPAERLKSLEIATNAFGQGYNLTMVQMAAAYSSLVNGGYYYEPHVVREIRDLEGNLIRKIDPILVRRTVSRETSDYMREAMRYVITNGTAGAAGTEGYMTAGKTGAAEKLPRGTGKYLVSFISVCPVEDPQYLLYVTIDEPYTEDQSQSLPAQQLSKIIWDKLYDYWNLYPENAEDAYTYDWSKLKDFSGESDAQNKEGIIDDPENSIEWIQEQETLENMEGVEKVTEETGPAESEEGTGETPAPEAPPVETPAPEAPPAEAPAETPPPEDVPVQG